MTTDRDDAAAVKERFREAALGVRRRLTGSRQPTPAEELRSLADEVEGLSEPRRWDRYGELGPLEELEHQVSELLGKPAAAMFPSGVMAQQAVLRAWSDDRGSLRVALPGLSHLLHHELGGPRLLHGLRYELLTNGAADRVLAGLPRPADAAALRRRATLGVSAPPAPQSRGDRGPR